MSSERLQLLEEVTELLKNEPKKLDLLTQMARGLLKPFEQESNPVSDLATEAFTDYFLNRLLVHHALADERFNKLYFEYAMQGALVASGHDARLTKGRTVPGADLVIVKGHDTFETTVEKYSLKTEASEGIQPDSVTISKLMEAAWMRGRDATGLHTGILEKIIPHLNQYDRIFMLRAFSARLQDAPAVRYDLVEISADLLRRVSLLAPSDIVGGTGAKKGGTATIRDAEGNAAFTLVFDGSDEKVTIRNLRVGVTGPTLLHASWIVPIPNIVRYFAPSTPKRISRHD